MWRITYKKASNSPASMNIVDEIMEKMKEYDLVLVYPDDVRSKIVIFLAKLAFPSIEYSPLSPIFGYRGEIYGLKKDRNLAEILINQEYHSVYVIRKRIKYNSKRLRDILHLFHHYEGGKMIIRYALTSLSGVLLNMAFFVILYKILNLWDILSLSISIELSIIITFLLHNYWVFKYRVYTKSIWHRFFGYHVILIAGMVINLGTYYVLSVMDVQYLLADFVGIVLAGIWSLYMVDVHVFFAKYEMRGEGDSNPRGQ